MTRIPIDPPSRLDDRINAAIDVAIRDLESRRVPVTVDAVRDVVDELLAADGGLNPAETMELYISMQPDDVGLAK
jgi:hypothetical protein